MPTRVYSPAGEPFDIPRRDLADKLILNEGWTQTAPAVETPVEETPKTPKRSSRRKTKKEEAVEVEVSANADDEETIEE